MMARLLRITLSVSLVRAAMEELTVEWCESSDNELLDISDKSASDNVLKRFIQAYESFPELWNTASPSYHNKYKRNLALANLLIIYKEIKPDAKVADVRKKINTLRSNCRREINKVKASMQSGGSLENVYKPTSWVFYALKFLHNTECPVTFIEEEESEDPLGAEQDNSIERRIIAAPPPQPTSVAVPSAIPEQTPRKKPKFYDPIERQNELLRKACSYLGSSAKIQKKDVPTIAIAWGEKLETLEPQQRAFAEKAINDILFEASQGTLQRNSVKINENLPQVIASPHSSGEIPQ